MTQRIENKKGKIFSDYQDGFDYLISTVTVKGKITYLPICCMMFF